MKKLMALCALAVSIDAFSQMNRGTWLAGGNGSANGGAIIGDRPLVGVFSLTLSPALGYFPVKNLMVESRFIGSYSRWTTLNEFVGVTALSAKYYFNLGKEQSANGDIWKPLAIYPIVGVQNGLFSTLGFVPYFNLRAGVGASIFFTKRLSVDAEIVVSDLPVSPLRAGSMSRFYMPVGVTYYFRK